MRYHWIICTKMMYYHQECYDEWIKYCVSLVFICPLLFNCDITVASSSVFLRRQMVGTSVLAALAGHLFCKAEKINPISATAATSGITSEPRVNAQDTQNSCGPHQNKVSVKSTCRISVGVNINQNPKFTDSLEVLKWLFTIMINNANSCIIDCGNPKAETTHSNGSSYLFYVLANWWLIHMIPFVCLHTILRTPYWRLA